jgi:glycosyltransferase involved in cell wall biosynthesis
VRLAFVVQRYGEGITGGSESLARAVAERLAQRDEVTVFTSCARDYVTWRNELPEGETVEGGVRIVRFPCEEERDLAAFNAFAEPLYRREPTETEERDFLRRQGPFCPRLVEALARTKDDFDAVVFFTYLYYPTVEGLKVASDRAVLVPTTHDEPPLRFGVFRRAFGLPRSFAFLTPPEADLVRSRFPMGDRKSLVTGMGVDIPTQPDPEGFRIRYEVDRPYLLYAGRIDAGKGCAEMLNLYERYREDSPGAPDLLLAGKLAMTVDRPGVRYLGFLDERDKVGAMAGAHAVLCPSPYESLSIVLLEAFAVSTPCLVTGRSAVLVDHCRRSNGGLWYESTEEFLEAVDLLCREDALRNALGSQGRAYVASEYRWELVLARFREVIEAAARRPATGL